MRYDYASPGGNDLLGWGRPRSNTIRTLLILNLGIWAILSLTGMERPIFSIFGLVPKSMITSLMFWQPITYMFLHAGFWHVGMNMLVLWMFGWELEQNWGGNRFLRYYLVTGAGAGLITVLFSLNSSIPVVGASGAIYGVLLAYGLTYPNRTVYLYFMFPVKVKYLVVFLALMAFFASFKSGSSVSHLTHLSGMIIGWFYMRSTDQVSHPGIGRQISLMVDEYKTRRELMELQVDNDLRKKVDTLLDKISRSGYASLTEEEQDVLYKASIKFSGKNRMN